MHELLSLFHAGAQWAAGLLALALAWLPLTSAPGQPQRQAHPSPARRAFRLTYMLTLSCALLVLLSGCGTKPSLATQSPAVPESLLQPPQEPVLLDPRQQEKPPS